MRRPLVVAAGAFVCFGVFWGSWAVATADVERFTGLSNAGLGLLLSGSSLLVGSRLRRREGPCRGRVLTAFSLSAYSVGAVLDRRVICPGEGCIPGLVRSHGLLLRVSSTWR